MATHRRFLQLALFILLLCPAVVMAGEASSSTKTVYLIRHAESEENRRLASLGRCFKKLGKFSLPSSSDVYASTELLNVKAQVDSSVSEVGVKQIANMGRKLQENDFLNSKGIQLVAHSPLLRAQETSEGMLGCRANTTKPESVYRVVELDLLIEKTPQEWTPLYFSTFKKRIASFEDWLGEQPENTVAIVGHSQYFKAMLGLDYKFGNCDVWEVKFDHAKRPEEKSKTQASSSSGTSGTNMPPQWSDLKLFQACDVKSSSQEED